MLDSGSVRALALGDTAFAGDLLAEKGECYVYTYKDYPRAAASYRAALALRESADNHFSLGITLGLMKADSATWHTDRSVQMAMQRGDTAWAIHYLRNHAQMMVYVAPDYPAAIRLFHRLMSLTDRADVLDISCFTLSECFLKLGLLDSAQYYLDKGQAYYHGRHRKFVTAENQFGYLQGLIDYTRTGSFDYLDLMRYNDSVNNALYALHSTIRQKDHTRDDLSAANLRLLIDRQRMQLWLLGALLLLLLTGGAAFYYLRRRRARGICRRACPGLRPCRRRPPAAPHPPATVGADSPRGRAAHGAEPGLAPPLLHPAASGRGRRGIAGVGRPLSPHRPPVRRLPRPARRPLRHAADRQGTTTLLPAPCRLHDEGNQRPHRPKRPHHLPA